jgi:hypothetical protein
MEKSVSRIASSERVTFKQALKIGALGGLAVILATEFIPATSMAKFASRPAVERTLPPRLDQLHALLIDAPSVDSLSIYNEEYVTNVIDSAGGYISRMTAGEMSTPENLPVKVLQLDPTGTYQQPETGLTEKCYSSKQLQDARTDYLLDANQPDDSRVAIVLKDELSCSSKQGGAVAWADTNEKTKMTVYDRGFDENIVMHEEGHIDGLNHATAIDCFDSNTERNSESMQSISKVDIYDLIAQGCTQRKRLDGNNLVLDDYGSYISTMGSFKSIAPENDRYNFVELNQLVPDVVRDRAIGPDAGEYALSLKDRELHMVTLDIPLGHPLRSIDATIDKLSIGVNRFGVFDESTPAVRMIAVGKTMTYELAYTFPYKLEYDKTLENLELYHDETLGIRVLLNPGADDSTANVTIDPLRK